MIRVGLFVTCLADTLFPDVGKATARLLERLGCTVLFPRDQTCCGQMHINTGYLSDAVPLVRRHVETFIQSGCDVVVAPSGSCVGCVRHQHAMVCARSGDGGLEAQASELAARTFELSEFLVDVLGVTDVGATFPHRVTYHPTCHSLRVLRVGERPQTLLRAVRQLELVEMPKADSCCGFGGTFAIKNAGVSTAMLADKLDSIISTRAEYCVASDASCLMQIGGGLTRRHRGPRPIHLAEILASTDEGAAS